jgi:hypothetical protein
MTNHDPRMNRISSNVQLSYPPNAASIRHSSAPEVPPVLDVNDLKLSGVNL